MNQNFILPLADSRANLETVGGKGMSLAKLVSAGFPVPDGFHITTEAYRKFVAANNLQPSINAALADVDTAQPPTLTLASGKINTLFSQAVVPKEIAEQIRTAYVGLRPGMNNNELQDVASVAVRSSATAEDLPGASFAGQQESYLNICGVDALLAAAKKCWASLWTARAIGYRARQGIDNNSAALAVVVQEMVFADAAGVLFTANPANGQRDEIVIDAAWGLGEAIVGGLVTPDTYIIEKSTGQILVREIADKQKMTIHVPGGTEEQAVPVGKRREPVLSSIQAKKLMKLAVDIEILYGMSMDIEWALARGQFAIVQARPITALPEPGLPIPTEWKLPKGAYSAMRNNIVELMMDPLAPLFKTFGLRSVNASMDRMLLGFFGNTDLLPDDPIITVNEYAYYNGSVRFWPMLRVILDTPGILRRMFTGAVERWTEVGRPRYIEIIKSWQAKPWHQLTSIEILEATRQLSEAAIDAYMALVSGVIPAAWMSEAWFTWQYKFIKREGDPEAPTFLMGFDSLPIHAEKALYELAAWIHKYPAVKRYLIAVETSTIVAQLNQGHPPANVDPSEWSKWSSGFKKYLDIFGHTIYNLDFGNPVPADDPAPVIDTFKLFLSGKGINPDKRQQNTEKKRREAVQSIISRLKGRRLRAFEKNLERAQKYAPLREDGLADVGLSYPLLRRMLREIGDRFVQNAVIEKIDDIFWLTQEEVEVTAARLDYYKTVEILSDLVPQRKAIWQSARKASPPMMLPQIKLFGKDLMELKTGGANKQKGGTLKGVGASTGTVTAQACVLHGPEDFAKMNTGDVLVASITTPAWTPLFARASAVVTDIGGPLSHGSIVAREYGIPAVLGTGTATKLIQNGQTITVDGDQGRVFLAKE